MCELPAAARLAWGRAQALKKEAREEEARAVRCALEATGWRVQRAASLLGLPGHTSLLRALGRHAGLRADLQAAGTASDIYERRWAITDAGRAALAGHGA